MQQIHLRQWRPRQSGTSVNFPYEICARTRNPVNPRMLIYINYYNHPSTSSHTTRYILPFSKLLNDIASLHVICHASQLGFSGTTYRFCSTYCLFDAMRVSTEHQRSLMAQGRFYIPFSEADAKHILSALDAADVLGPIMIQKRVGGFPESRKEAKDDGEGRIGDVMADILG